MVVFVFECWGVLAEINDEENAEVGEEIGFSSEADKNDVK